jgi:hypothetical protein
MYRHMHNPALHFEHLAECYNIVGINLTQKISRKKRERERRFFQPSYIYTGQHAKCTHLVTGKPQNRESAVCGPLNIRARYIFFFFFFFAIFSIIFEIVFENWMKNLTNVLAMNGVNALPRVVSRRDSREWWQQQPLLPHTLAQQRGAMNNKLIIQKKIFNSTSIGT